MRSPKVTIITPTYKRDPAIMVRCIKSVAGQGYNVQHLICTDGESDNRISDACKMHSPPLWLGNGGIEYNFMGIHTGRCGDHVRQAMLEKARGEFTCFLDDDNILLPDYFDENIQALHENPEAEFAVSKCIWFHPIDGTMCVLKGLPVKVGQVDSLQCFFRTPAIREHGWLTSPMVEGRNTSDGATYESMAAKHKFVFIDKILSIHF